MKITRKQLRHLILQETRHALHEQGQPEGEPDPRQVPGKHGIADADIVMMLRLQTERMAGTETPSQREYFNLFGLNQDKLNRAAPKALIMHPGPMNRGVEIDSATADDVEKSLIRTQVEIGVAARMACLEALAGASGDRR